MQTMSPWCRAIGCVLALIGLTGCHARYRKMAEHIGSVQPMIIDPGDPVVDVRRMGIMAKASRVEARLQRAIAPEQVAAALEASILDAPARFRLPHRISSRGRHRMRVEVLDYGIGMTARGPVAQTTIQVQIERKRDGARIYRASTTCAEPLGSVAGIPLPGLEQVRTLQALSVVHDMRRRQLRAAMLVGVERCGERVVDRMVRHAR